MIFSSLCPYGLSGMHRRRSGRSVRGAIATTQRALPSETKTSSAKDPSNTTINTFNGTVHLKMEILSFWKVVKVFLSPWNLSGAWQHGSVAAFSQVTEIAGDSRKKQNNKKTTMKTVQLVLRNLGLWKPDIPNWFDKKLLTPPTRCQDQRFNRTR